MGSRSLARRRTRVAALAALVATASCAPQREPDVAGSAAALHGSDAAATDACGAPHDAGEACYACDSQHAHDPGCFHDKTTTCGVGACLAHGTATCDDGTVVDDCVPGDPCETGASVLAMRFDRSHGTPRTDTASFALARSGLVCLVVTNGTDPVSSADLDVDHSEFVGPSDLNPHVHTILRRVSLGAGPHEIEALLRSAPGSWLTVDVLAARFPAPSDTTCDGVDDDCDGSADEDYVGTATTCGSGACVGHGHTTCVSGHVGDTCHAGGSGTTDTTCDGIDDDCDGSIDEDYVGTATTCGVGACGATGTTSCVAGHVVDSCHAGTPAPSDASCNGVDDDCDGLVDEDYLGTTTNCGIGACAAHGSTTCVSGHVVDSCHAGTPAPSDATCNGVDDDCDGAVDEDYVSTPTSCGIGACSATGTTSCVSGHVVDSCHAGAPAPSDATCNGVDDDCDGATDEDYVSLATVCGVGACAATGATSCSAGHVVDSCHAGMPAASDATCDAVDDDCDGVTDEDFVATATSCGLGACVAVGLTACVSGHVLDSCRPGAPAPSDASCNGIDDDCDGAVDEDFVGTSTTCGVGGCAAVGSTSCVAGHVVDSCRAGSAASADATCDGIDDDCDGTTDEDFASSPTACGTGACSAAGATSCVAGHVVDSCAAGTPAVNDPTCNGIDDDCDGLVDEDYASTATTCGVGACAATGVTSCVAGHVLDSCHAAAAASSDATCDGVDDDCDGVADEDYAPVATSCGIGVCAASGLTSCTAGHVVDSCSPGTPASTDATCNGLDDDCDGVVDEDYASVATTCGTGACAAIGVTSCITGHVVDSCHAGSAASADTTCDDIDDDCDGVVDEDYLPVTTACGVGACAAYGATRCASGHVVDSCAPGVPAAHDATCNAIDDDCNGFVDDGFVATPTSCGVGACAATGTASCASGVVLDSCHAGTPGANDTTCDGVDDDCNGSADDGYVPTPTTCGTGACGSTGTTSCVAGHLTDSCTAGAPAAADATCDGTDDDCDGLLDEDFVSTATTCGTGACAATGATSCVGGHVIDACLAGTPAVSDATCDGIDDDCDGLVDEDFAGVATTCGVGACAATGASACTDGHVVDSCVPGVGAPSDATCDGIDDDCNGLVDDAYVSAPTTCGVGACAATGVASCASGHVTDTCTPGAPLDTTDSTCDGVDDDCDGSVDEDYGVLPPPDADAGVFVPPDDGGVFLPPDDGGITRGPPPDSDPFATTCGVGACAASGRLTCVAGHTVDSCAPGTPAATDATCDFIDDDCDGTFDEDFGIVPTTCGLGACANTGTAQCEFGTIIDSCYPGPPWFNDLSCNGVDDDCDGLVDEDFIGTSTNCGVGACAANGRTACVSGAVVDSCSAGTPAPDDTTCNGIDDDCNGRVDDGFVDYIHSCGVGACATTGAVFCASGAIIDLCVPRTPAASDATCNGIDDDCDGVVDEDYVSVPSACGVGACAATGVTSCVAGHVSSSCTPGTPAPTDTTCNGVDDNCNGTADEGFVPYGSTCGVGACRWTGGVTCVAGALVDSCVPRPPTSSTDVSCNNVDDDCDGSVDEDFVVTPTTCGIGACASTGATTCVTGTIVNTCHAGTPAASDATCDGIDDDCDNTFDEDYVRVPTSCGVGACTRAGLSSCLFGGIVRTNCTPGTPTASDATCNGIDEDCDGVTDEDYASTATTCGVGACLAHGTATCAAGTVTDTCAPGPAAASDASCDGIDEDCDGVTDDDFVSTPVACGTGVCAATGATHCVSAHVTSTCAPAAPPSTLSVCAAAGDDCGTVSDGCDGTVTCGTCSSPATCVSNHCTTKRPTLIVITGFEATADPSTFLVDAQLFDQLAPDTSMAGRTLTFTSAPDSAAETTDAGSAASAPFAVVASVPRSITVSFAGDATYLASTATSSIVRRGGGLPTKVEPPPAGSEGTRFVLGFPQNAGNRDNLTPTRDGDHLYMYLTSRVPTVATVSVPGIGFTRRVALAPFVATTVELPRTARMGTVSTLPLVPAASGLIEAKGVEVTSVDPIGVSALDYIPYSADALLGLPVAQLGTDYIVGTYNNEKWRDYSTAAGTEAAIVATADDTEVTITPSVFVSPGPAFPSGIPAGVPTTVHLDRDQTLQIANEDSTGSGATTAMWEDLSGTQIRATHPVAVFGAHAATTVYGFPADHLVEQLPPEDTFGRRFLLVPYASRLHGDVVRVIASVDATEVRVDGTLVATLDRGEHLHYDLASDAYRLLEATQPVLVLHFAKSESVDAGGSGTPGGADPFMDVVPPAEQFLPSYVFQVPDATFVVPFRHYANVIARAEDVGSVRLDGVAPATPWTPVGTSGWVATQIPMAPGTHRVDSTTPSALLGAEVYGFGAEQSYGYPAGMTLHPIACTPTISTPGDHLDNDCDGHVDEELLNGIDDDGDGLIDEDTRVRDRATDHVPVAHGSAFRGLNVRPLPFFFDADDADGDPLTYRVVTGPAHGTVSASGAVGTYFPDPALSSGTFDDALTFVANDGLVDSAPATVSFHIGPVPGLGGSLNEPPLFSTPVGGWFIRLNAGVTEGDLHSLITAYDFNFDPLTFSLEPADPSLAPAVGVTLADSAPGAVYANWHVTRANVGRWYFEVRVDDGHGGSGHALYFVDVSYDGSNGTPIIRSTPTPRVAGGDVYVYDVDAVDPDGDPITYTLGTHPATMGIDATTGLVTWPTTAADVGDHPVVVTATDSHGATASQSFTVMVLGDGPRFISAPVTLATQGVGYSYRAQAIDATPGDILTYSVVSGPGGLSVDGATGLVTWTPALADVGTHAVTLLVSDALGHTDSQSYSILVIASDVAPRITSTPPTRSRVDDVLVYDVDAFDPEPTDVLTFSLDAQPGGATIDGRSGVIQWIAPGTGSYPFTVRVTDLAGAYDVQSYVVEVRPDLFAPAVTLTATPSRGAPGTVMDLAVTADATATSVTLDVAGTPLALDASRHATYTSATPGTFVATAHARDAAGNEGTSSVALSFTNAADTDAPHLSIDSPVRDGLVTYIVPVVGTVHDANLAHYTLAVREIGQTAWQQIGEGFTSVDSGTLGRLDSTLLRNGYHELRLFAEDVNGLTAEIVQPFRVDGNAKVGVVKLSFTDAQLDLLGIPVTVTRTYDSRDKTDGDFGFGWKLDVSLGQLRHGHPLSDGFVIWSFQDFHGFELPCQRVTEQVPHYTEVRLSETEWYLFRPIIVNTEAIAGHCAGDVAFEQVDGTAEGAHLDIIGSTHVFSTAYGPSVDPPPPSFPSTLTDFDTSAPYDVGDVRLRLADGRQIDVSKLSGVTRIQDVDGNTVQVAPTGITHSRGHGVVFHRRPDGRIGDIVDSAGRTVHYQYNTAGDLVGVVDPLGRLTGYTYRADIPHHIDTIIGHDGTQVAALDYQPDGRVILACDAQGACSDASYDLGAMTQTSTDATRRPVFYSYDGRGNVTRADDALGNVTTVTYDIRDHALSQTDGEGNTTSYTYDPSGNHDLLSKTLPHDPTEDAESFTTRWTWDLALHPFTARLPTGGTQHYDRDPSGHETALTDDDGRVVRATTYNGDGTTATYSDRFGTRTYDAYELQGKPTRITDAAGRVFTLTYDDAGRTTAVSSGGVTMTWTYDAIGRLAFCDYGHGVTVTYEYGSARTDRWTAIFGPTFGRVERRFGPTGRLIGWTMPNGDTFARTYDGAGRLSDATDELGNVTRFHYDAAGRPESVEDVALGASEHVTRDRAGRVTGGIDFRGTSTSSTRDPRGGLRSRTDGAGHTWTYDEQSATSAVTTPAGETTVTSRGPYGLTTSQVLPGGATTGATTLGKTSVDESYRFPLTQTDESSRTRAFTYDALGGLHTATDLGGDTWTYEYAQLVAGDLQFDASSGRVWLAPRDVQEPLRGGADGDPTRPAALGAWTDALSSVTSPEGQMTRWHRDERGHVDLVEYPTGGVESRTYDTAGHLDVQTRPDGTDLDHDYDIAGHLLSRIDTDGSAQSFTYGPGDRVETLTDATGMTTHHYDARGRYIGLTQPTGGAVSYGRDGSGHITAVGVRAPLDVAERTTTYVRDGNDNITEVHDPLGGLTTMTYDPDGRLGTRTLPNGVYSTWGYDSRSRVTSIVHRHGPTGPVIVSLTYVRAPSGEPTRISREDGTYVDYSYDTALRLARETYHAADDDVTDEIAYTYDRDGNRRTRTTSLGVETYHYGPGSELLSIDRDGSTIATYTYDTNGRVTTIERDGATRVIGWDADDDVVSVTKGDEEWRWAFDAEGRRVRLDHRIAGVTDDAHRWVVGRTLSEALESPHAATDDAGTAKTGWVFAGEQPLSRYDTATGEAVYYLEDAMGSVVGLANATGSTATIAYDGFGNERAEVGGLAATPAGGDFRFQGMWSDTAVSLYYVRARAYDVTTGTFLSRDRALPDVRSPERLSAYVFCAANPLIHRDPSGLDFWSTVNTAVTWVVNEIIDFVSWAVSPVFRFLRLVRALATVGVAAEPLVVKVLDEEGPEVEEVAASRAELVEQLRARVAQQVMNGQPIGDNLRVISRSERMVEYQSELPGGPEAARSLFRDLVGRLPSTTGTDPDVAPLSGGGFYVTFREAGSSGLAKLEINNELGGFFQKITFTP